MHFSGEQHHTRVGTPPQHGIIVAEPRKDAVGVGIEQPLRRKVASCRQQAIGILQRASDRRKGIVRTEKGNHVSLIINPLLRPNLTTLEAAIGGPVITRFAPSPTGYLHLGHVVNAIYVWGVARALGGRVLLRVEDHDRIRCRPEYELALVEDLCWLGFVPDAGREPLLRQSETPWVYEQALEWLRGSTKVYACDCSRKDIGGERYDGRCRARGLEFTAGRGIRVQLGASAEAFEDALFGRLTQVPAEQCGDLLVRDRDGHWTYQFAVTVDDLRQDVTLVIRGRDLVSSTGRQILLARMLGRQNAPVFLHHPLIHDNSGEKLSKSAGDTGVRELRAAGLTAPEVIGIAGASVGLVGPGESLNASDVSQLFEP
jgi:glutamyl-Q tRNA(Asp) synthetase